VRIRRRKWAKEELEEAQFYIDNPTEYKNTWHEKFSKKQPLHIELRLWKRKFYCKLSFKAYKYKLYSS